MPCSWRCTVRNARRWPCRQSRYTQPPMSIRGTLRSIERVYRDWDAVLHAKDVEAAVALYAEDVQLDSVGAASDRLAARLSRVATTCGIIRIVFARTPAEPGSSSHRFLHRRSQAYLGVSARDAGWRSDGLRRIDGDRKWPEPTALRLSGWYGVKVSKKIVINAERARSTWPSAYCQQTPGIDGRDDR